MSETPYFKWAAHDDLLAPGFLAACVEALDRDPAAVLASPGSTLSDETGARLPHSPERGGSVDRAGVRWPGPPEKNAALTAAHPSRRLRAPHLLPATVRR